MKRLFVMVVSSNARLREHLFGVLSKDDRYRCVFYEAGKKAIGELDRHPFRILYSDRQLADMSGLELVVQVQQSFPSVYSLLGSGQGKVEDVIAAMQAGAKDFILDPFASDLIVCALDKAHQLLTKDQRSIVEPCHSIQSFITKDQKLLDILDMSKKVAPSDASVLITGESGTGKERLASFIHANSNRNNEIYVAVNCAALPEHLSESELFGHERGSFTGAISRKIGKFEAANKGTLVLDEVTEMSLPLQAKLLRVLQEREITRLGSNRSIPIDVRIIAISNRKMNVAVREGAFREDLFYRLNVIPLTIPPLRERNCDVPVLAEWFLKQFSNDYEKSMSRISDAAMERLCLQAWPGNVRELENTIKRGVLLGDGQELLPDHLLMKESGSDFSSPPTAMIGKTVKEMEKDLITNTLQFVNGNRTHAAKMLGISIRTLRNKLNEYIDQ